ncbi:NAD(P)/FAD-dependent oxidoreductase [Oscillatoria sp. FACHB-1406]|uniref:NAD(P)/FAD-dependent oxidoreductase n=1 Tax=Oscillatoria sp. FACHB-1406 TaxID=2692846 RepID=UPI001683DBE4|nr:NAD(P)/FAD-dependent oxidoreductase [Oscillatoria sp. FACHB-1406]MBD2576732.1 NAD(P)/FAD-dependent oxidoreductase [Oscillatoria sp. FACHB-1406]
MNRSNPTVIIGAGFAGLFTALHLRDRDYPGSVVAIDPQERFVFKPMLYEMLTGELEENAVCPTYAELLDGSGIDWVRDEVKSLDLAKKQVTLASGTQYCYHRLVLTAGSVQGYLGTEGAQENAFAFRTREDAIALKSHLQDCLQQSLQTEDDQQRQSRLTFAVVGAGPAGIEMAATLADLLPSWYGKMGGKVGKIRIVLANHSQEILSGDANEALQEPALKALQARTVPVELLLGVGVKAVYRDRVEYQPAESDRTETLATQTTIWTAGTDLNPLIKSLSSQIPKEHLDKHGLPLVNPTLQLLDFPDVFAAGDCAIVAEHSEPPLAQVAYQQGETIASNLIALSQGKPLQTSEVNLRGTLLKLGLNNSIANLFDKVQIDGKSGDILRSLTYLELLPTPWHNFKATSEWIKEEVFHRYYQPEVYTDRAGKRHILTPKEEKARSLVKALAILAPLALLGAAYLALRTPPSEKLSPRPSTSPTQTDP